MNIRTLFAFMLVVMTVSLEALTLIPENITQLYLEPEQPSVLRFSATGGDQTDAVPYTLRDYFERKVGQGVLKRRDGKYETTLNLKQGFYELDLGTQRIGVVVLPRYTGRTDRYFCLEALLNNNPEKLIREELAVIKRFGVSTIREYHNWSRQEPAPGKWKRNSEKVYPLAVEAGIEVTTFLSAPPTWIGANGKKNTLEYIPYPRDLTKLESSLVPMVERRKPALKTFQIENEPILKKIPGDSYLPLLAACSWIFQKNRVDLPVILAAFASWETGEDMLNPYFAVGFLDYGDIFDFHTYKSPESMIPLIQTYRSMMAGSPKHGMPMWVTESGKPWSRGISNPRTVYGGKLGKLRAFPGEDKIGAQWIAMKGVEGKAGGVASYFPFTMRFFAEGISNFGMTDFYCTPQRSMAAYLFSIRELSNKPYSGDLKAKPAGIRIARIFSDGKQAVLVLYATKIDEQCVKLKDLPVKKLYAADGSELHSDADGNVKFCGGLLYAELDAAKAKKFINPDTLAMKLFELSKNYKPVARKARPVVYQFAYWNEKQKDATHYVSAPEKLEFHLFNLSSAPVETEPELVLPKGGKIISQSHSGKMLLKPNSSQTITYKLDMSGVASAERVILLKDQTGNGNRLYLPFMDVNAKGNLCHTYEMNRASRWKANSSGKMVIGDDPKEHAIHFGVEWNKKVDHWVYPEYILDSKESLEGLRGIAFEIRAKQGADSKRFQHVGVMLSDGKHYRMAPFLPPGEQWEKRVVAIPGDWKKSDFDRIRIGMGPVDDQLDYWVRDIKLFFKK